MATKSPDEVLVELLLTARADLVESRVYHIEQYQMLDTLNKLDGAYPCIVYELLEDSPSLELAADSKFAIATYALTVTSPKSSDIRSIATVIKNMNDATFIQEVCDAYENINWINVTSDVEGTEFAIEQQEKGLKTSTLTVLFEHWGDN